MKDKKGSILPQDYLENFHLFEALKADSVGTDYRAAELKNGKPHQHKIITHVHPFLFQSPNEWNNANVMFERLQETDSPHLFAPEKIIKKDGDTFLVYPYIRGKTLDKIVEDAGNNNQPIPFDLACAICIAAATLIEQGTAAVGKGRNAGHGFLTPDHILVDYEGNIYLKYFGLWPLFDENETAVSEMIRKYGPWLSPEFIRRERIVKQSDFYYLGYLAHRMLTGNYFSYLPGEDFETTFTSVSFASELPSTDIEFLTTLINFFKKTLNPDISKRFADIQEFKNYILNRFRAYLPQYHDFQSDLSDYMNELYSGVISTEDEALSLELSTPLEEPGGDEGIEDKIMETMPVEIEERKKSRPLTAVLFILIIAVLATGGYFLYDQINKAKETEEIASQLLEDRDNLEQRYKEVQDKLKNLEQQKTSGVEEQQQKDQQIAQLEEQKAEIIRKQENLKQQPPNKKEKPAIKPAIKTTKIPGENTTDPKPRTEKKQPPKIVKPSPQKESPKKESPKKETPQIITPQKETPKQAPPAKEIQKQPEPTPKPKTVPVLTAKEVTVKPKKKSGPKPQFPPAMRQTYMGRRATVQARLLIDENGNVQQVEILDKSKVPAEVGEVIAAAFKKWKYKPASKDGQKVKVWWPEELKIHFRPNM